jgi:glycosyltransferase involved in cell wall biosynthesis
MAKFKRGNGPLVSVIMPTRGRSQLLCESIDSLYSLAKDKTLIEFLVKVDDDDKDTMDTVVRLSSLLPIKMLVYPKGAGYHEIHHWINDLCALTKGDWIYLFNDDSKVKTPEWDQMLLNVEIDSTNWHGVTDICMFVTPTITRPGANEFILLRRKVFEIVGHFSLSPHGDNWIYRLMSMIDSAFTIPIEVDHFSEKMTDDTRKDSVEAYKTTITSLIGIPGTKQRLKDAVKLLDYIEKKVKN